MNTCRLVGQQFSASSIKGSHSLCSRRRSSVSVVLLLLVVITPSVAQAPPRSIALPEDVVEDRFIAYLFALLYDDISATISGADLRTLFPEYDDETITPMDFLDHLERRRSADYREVLLTFEHPVAHPAPINILGYKPVILHSSQALLFREVQFYRTSVGTNQSVDQAYVLFLEQGALSVDFARWLEFLVDDVAARVVLAAHFDEKWYGAVAGYNNSGDVVTTVYDMARGRFLARPPRELIQFAASMIKEGSSPGPEE